MSTRVNSASVLFCMKNIFEWDPIETLPEDAPSLLREQYAHDGDLNHNGDWNGWKLTNSTFPFKRVIVDVYKKDRHTVFVINESELAIAGVLDISVFSSDLGSLKAFKKDFNITTEIDCNEAVVQVL